MTIRFICTSCEKRIRVPDGSEGRRVKCPKCGAVQRVPEDGEEVQVQVLEPPPEQETEHAQTQGHDDSDPGEQEQAQPDADNPLAALAALGGGAVGDDDDTPPSPPPTKRSTPRMARPSGDRSKSDKPEAAKKEEPSFVALAKTTEEKPASEVWPPREEDTWVDTSSSQPEDGTKSGMVRATLRGEKKPPPSDEPSQSAVFSALSTTGVPVTSKSAAPRAISLSSKPAAPAAADTDEEPTHEDEQPAAPFERPSGPAAGKAAVAPAAPVAPAPRPVRMPPYSMMLAMAVVLRLIGLVCICFGFYLALAKGQLSEQGNPLWLIEYRLIALFSGLVVGSVTWAIGEAVQALRDLARNSFRIGQI